MEQTPYNPKYDTQTRYEKSVQPHLDPVDTNETVPMAVPKHYILLDVITPMVFSTKSKGSSAYATLEKNMEDMEVADLDYLEELDIMNWFYLNIILRKKFSSF